MNNKEIKAAQITFPLLVTVRLTTTSGTIQSIDNNTTTLIRE
jgi:hypothetical protein